MIKKKIMLVFGTRPEAINFSPTPLSEKNLKEEKAHGNIYVTGNTVIDALHMVVDKLKNDEELAKEQNKVPLEAGKNPQILNRIQTESSVLHLYNICG